MIHNYGIRSESPREYTSTTTYNLSEDETIKLALEILEKRLKKSGEFLTSSKTTKDLLRLKYAEKEHEIFGIITLTNKHEVININEMFTGTIDSANVFPREIVKSVLNDNAAAVILFHNHPSGDSEESRVDIEITKKIKDALNTIDVRVLDHLIIGSNEVTSFSDKGLL